MLSPCPREYSMIIKDQAFSASYDFAPPHPTTPPSGSCLYFSVFLCVGQPVELIDVKRGGGGIGESQIIRRRESLVNYKSFNTLCSASRKDLDYWLSVWMKCSI